MSKSSDLPRLDFVTITKKGSASGNVRIAAPDGSYKDFPYDGSLPFSKTDIWGEYSSEGSVSDDPTRPHFLERIVNLIMDRQGSDVLPIRFEDAAGRRWKGDKGGVPRLVATGRYYLSADGNYLGRSVNSVDENVRPSPETRNEDPVQAERERAYYERLTRPGQQRLRRQLLRARGRCAISACQTSAMLEAAHVIPVSDDGSDHSSNAILLRADIHRLFDMNLLAIRPRDGSICTSRSVHDVDVPKSWHYKERVGGILLSEFSNRWNTFCREHPDRSY